MQEKGVDWFGNIHQCKTMLVGVQRVQGEMLTGERGKC